MIGPPDRDQAQRPPTPQRGDRRRDDLLAALDEKLRTQRLDQIAVADLTDAAGITRSAFYFYYDSKAMAVMGLLEGVEDEARLAIHEIASDSGDLRDRLVSVLHRLAAGVRMRPHVFRAAVEAKNTDIAVRAFWEDDRVRLRGPVAEWIRTERAAGRLTDGPDADLLADLLVGLNESLMDRLASDPDCDPGPPVETVAEIWDRVLRGRTPDAPPADAHRTDTSTHPVTTDPGTTDPATTDPDGAHP